MAKPTTFTISRTGRTALRFAATLVAESTGSTVNGAKQHRYHDVRLYRTTGGNYVLEVAYVTDWQDEIGHTWAEEVLPERLADILLAIDPTAHVRGFPPLEKYEWRQQALLDQIRAAWGTRVAEIMASAPETTVEVK